MENNNKQKKNVMELIASTIVQGRMVVYILFAAMIVFCVLGLSKHRLTRAHREKQLKMSCQALHNAPPNRT